MNNTPDTCPLCGTAPTQERTRNGDAVIPLDCQRCSNGRCELPWRLWERVDQLIQANHKYRERLLGIKRALDVKQ